MIRAWKNVQVRRATPTGDIETRVQPNKRWYEVIFETDDNPDDDEDDDDDTFEASKKAKAKAKAEAKAQVKDMAASRIQCCQPIVIRMMQGRADR